MLYSYALNNPLIYNDPSDEDILLASLIFFVGQYALYWLDNVINVHMSPWSTKFEGIGHTQGYGTGFEQFSDIDKSTHTIIMSVHQMELFTDMMSEPNRLQLLQEICLT